MNVKSCDRQASYNDAMRRIAKALFSAVAAVLPLALAFLVACVWDELVTIPNRDDARALNAEYWFAKDKEEAIYWRQQECRDEGRICDFTAEMDSVQAELADIDRRCMARFGHPGVGLQSRRDVAFLEWMGFDR